MIVHQELHAILFPDKAKHVELLTKIAGRKIIVTIVGAFTTTRLLPVHRTRDLAWSASHQLHDIRLTATRPGYRADIRTQHPQRRPHPLGDWQLGADIDPPIGKLLKTRSHDPPGRIIVAPIRLLPGFDDQMAGG